MHLEQAKSGRALGPSLEDANSQSAVRTSILSLLRPRFHFQTELIRIPEVLT
jgi:hypothetical protein